MQASTCEFPEAPMDYCGCNGCLDPESKKEATCLDSADFTELISATEITQMDKLMGSLA